MLIFRVSVFFLQAYGDAGVVKIIKILEREIIYGMQLLGAATVSDLVPELVGYPCLTLTTMADGIFQLERVDWQPILPALAKL